MDSVHPPGLGVNTKSLRNCVRIVTRRYPPGWVTPPRGSGELLACPFTSIFFHILEPIWQLGRNVLHGIFQVLTKNIRLEKGIEVAVEVVLVHGYSVAWPVEARQGPSENRTARYPPRWVTAGAENFPGPQRDQRTREISTLPIVSLNPLYPLGRCSAHYKSFALIGIGSQGFVSRLPFSLTFMIRAFIWLDLTDPNVWAAFCAIVGVPCAIQVFLPYALPLFPNPPKDRGVLREFPSPRRSAFFNYCPSSMDARYCKSVKRGGKVCCLVVTAYSPERPNRGKAVVKAPISPVRVCPSLL